MDSNFDSSLYLVLAFEGGYTDDPSDHGGATNKGITQREYDSYRQNEGQPQQSVSSISDAEVRDIYYNRYWLVAKCDKLPAGVDSTHFDAAVNAGPTQAAKFLQRALGVVDDGVIGDKTLAAVSAANAKSLLKSYVSFRVNFYIDLAIKDITQLKFLKGWIRRAISFL